MKKKKNKKFTKVERFLYKSSLMIIILLLVGIVFTSTSVSKMNIELQDMNKKVEKAEDTNESLFVTLVLIIIGFIYTYIKKRFTKYLKKCKIKLD